MDWPTKTIRANNIDIAYAEQGSGPLVLFCHGWPELSFSWRHQLPAFAAAGYRAVAPDMRGYGGTSKPWDIEAYTLLHFVADMTALVEALGEKQAIVIGHDWGAPVAWHCAMFRPDVFRAVAALSVPQGKRGPARPLDMLTSRGVKNFYWQYFQNPGVAEAEFERDWDHSIRAVLYGGGLSLMLKEGQGMLADANIPPNPPDWISEEEIQFYIKTFKRTGLRGGFNWYRNLDRNWELTGLWQTARIRQPALFVGGGNDPVITGMIGAARLLEMKDYVLDLRGSIILEGAGHWLQQECPAEVNAALLKWARDIDGDLKA